MMEERKNLSLGIHFNAILSKNQASVLRDEHIEGMQPHIYTLKATLLSFNIDGVK
jgi:hypothetical protein